MNTMSKILMFLLLSIGLHRSALAQPAVSWVAEMAPLPLEEAGPLQEAYQVSDEEQAAWEHTQTFVDSFISDEQVRALSSYATEAMKTYTYQAQHPTLLVGLGANQQNVVYEVTLDELPSHARLVKRYLKLYIVGLRFEGRFLPNRFIVTIRGERFE